MQEIEMQMALETMETLRDSYEVNAKEIDELKRYHEGMNKRLAQIEDHMARERAALADTQQEQSEEVDKLNDSLGVLLNDYNHLNANKASLEYELQVYKRLLDSQLDRLAQAPPPPPPPAEPAPAPKVDTSVSSNAFGGMCG